MTVTAVRTTGIYCQPGCGAKPLSTNTVRYPSAAAAEADGFRSCLRCRPYRMPVLPDNAPSLVCRAVSLILDGFLDSGTEDALAACVAVSPRHLRRLFLQNLGATPDGLARSARAHFARRLLDETDLPVTDIAFVAGFGSVRQFNREMQRVFRRPPRELRELRRVTDRLVADGGLAVRLPHHGHLDWPSMIDRSVWLVPGVEAVQGQVYRRTIAVQGATGALELTAAGPNDLQLTLHLPHWEELVHLVGRSRRLAGLDEPGQAREPGLRPWAWLERAVAAVLTDGLSADEGRDQLHAVVGTLGHPAPGLQSWGLTHHFPSPRALNPKRLQACGIDRPRAAAAAALATAARSRAVQLDARMSPAQTRAALAAVDGLTTHTRNLITAAVTRTDRDNALSA